MTELRDRINRNLNLIVMPTEKCNFRCTYCYEDFAIGKMQRSTIEGIKALVSRRLDRFGLQKLSLSWFGGEPLMAKDIVFELSEFFNDLHESGSLKYFTGGLTTNASYLTPAVLSRLVKARQNVYQISLDGFGAGHDVTRRHATGRGTFDGIWSNLIGARDSNLDFKILLRLHLTPENLESMETLVRNLAISFAGDQRFSVLFKLVENYGGANGADIVSLTEDAAGPAVDGFMTELANAGIAAEDGVASEFESMDSAMSEGSGDAGDATETTSEGCYVCYASKPWSLVIRANGAVNKCTVDLNSDLNNIGTIDQSGLLRIDNEKMAYWIRGYLSKDNSQLGCPAHAHAS